MKKIILLACLLWSANLLAAPSQSTSTVEDVKITILSDMVTSYMTHAEWGFAALVEVKVGGTWQKLLFDTGAEPETVLHNAKIQGVDICTINHVVLSHNHGDHTMGLVKLRETCRATNPNAFKYAYVGGPEIFWARPMEGGGDDNVMLVEKGKFEALGGQFIMPKNANSNMPIPGFPGVWASGKTPRLFDEKTYPGEPLMINPNTGRGEVDIVPEDQSLIIKTAKGLIVITGCAHAGVINTINQARSMFRTQVHALIGGFHLFGKNSGNPSTVGTLDWVAAQMKGFNISYILGAHCTGLQRIVFLRKALKMTDKTAVVSTIDTKFTLSDGIVASDLNLPIEKEE